MFQQFLAHIFPKVTLKKNLRIYYTFCLGGIAATSFLLLVASGALLLIYYTPSPNEAYNSIVFIEENVFYGKYVRSFHRIACYTFLASIFLHTLRVIFTGAFIFRSYNWVIGLILLFLAICSGYTGYLLPMDQLAYWATQTGTELLSVFPFGEGVKHLLAPDGIGGRLTLIRFYALHVFILPFTTLTLIVMHFYRVRKERGVLPYL